MAARRLFIATIGLLACGGSAVEATAEPSDSGALIEDSSVPTPVIDGGSEGSTTTDAGNDAGPSPGGEVFSDDFEDGDLDNDWDFVNVCPGCNGTIDQGVFLAQTKSVLTQETAYAHVRTTILGKPTRVRLSFDATFPSVTLTKGTLAIATVDVSTSHFFSLFLRHQDPEPPAAALVEQGGPSAKRHVLTSLPPPNAKTRVVIDIDLGGGTASVSFGGTVALANDPIGKTIADDPTIRVGLLYVYGPQDPFEARFDDVLLEYF
jgi:hypothetical protein